MDCKTCEKLIMQYIEDALDEEASEQVRLHLQLCVKCKSEYRTLSELRKVLISEAPISAGPAADLWDRVSDGIRGHSPAYKIFPLRQVVSAAAVLIVCFIGIFFVLAGRSSREPVGVPMATKLTSPGISSKPVPEQPTAQKPEKELSEEPEEQPIVMAKAPEDTAEPDKPDRQPAPQANLDTLTEQRAQLKPDTGTDSDAHSQPAPVVQAENWTADESPAAPRMARLGASEANTAPAGGLDKVKSDSASAPASAQLAPAGNDGKSVSGYAGKSAPETAAPSALSEGAAPPAAAPPRSPGASIQLRNQPDSNRATPAQMLADLRDCIKSGDKSTAESLADKLHTMGNLTQQQWQHLGEIEQQLGRPKKAIQAYQQAAKGPDTAISNKAKSKIAELSN